MISLFGWITIGKLPSEQERHKSLLKLIRQIMATQTEIAAELVATKDRLVSATNKITKIGTETDSLLTKIKELEAVINAGTVSPELQAAFDGVKAQVDSLESAVTATDEKVPDAP